MPPSTGTRLDRHEILAPLGTGGLGAVYRAKDPKLGREVAVQILPASLSRVVAAKLWLGRPMRQD